MQIHKGWIRESQQQPAPLTIQDQRKHERERLKQMLAEADAKRRGVISKAHMADVKRAFREARGLGT